MKKGIKFGFNSYFKPTPKNMRIIGDSLLGASTFLSGYSIITDNPKIALIVLIVGAIGKFLSNFFHDEQN